MEETANIEKVYTELLALKKEIDFIKRHMVDADSVLTPEEEDRLDESLIEFKEGKTISLEELEKERKNVKNRVFK
ncbi:MAG: hypothetical protein KKD18_02875 [Nanoarchaeota archaeon]|nr:hypothetical protein [Nanoarchaeota archaeon]